MPSARRPTGWNRVAPTWACATRSDPAFHLKMQLDAGAKAPAFFFPRIHKPNRRMGRAQRNPSTREPGHADGLTRSAVESRWALPMLRYLDMRSEEHTSELQSLMRISFAVFFLKKK